MVKQVAIKESSRFIPNLRFSPSHWLIFLIQLSEGESSFCILKADPIFDDYGL
jgi:hypothetical protein